MGLQTSMSILVVDDYQTMIRIIRNLLRQLGFEDVDDAADGTARISRRCVRRSTTSSSPTGTWSP